MRHFHVRRRKTGDDCELVQNLLQREVFPAEYVALAWFCFFQSEQMSASDFAHVCEIQPRLDIGGKVPIQEIENNATRWSRFNVPLAYRIRWIHDYHWRARASCG